MNDPTHQPAPIATEHPEPALGPKRTNLSPSAMFALGLLIGILLAAVAGMYIARSNMLVAQPSTMEFEPTVTAIEAAIAESGWVVVSSKRMNDSLRKQGVEFAPRVQLISLCQPEYAKQILADARHVSPLMPCTIAVYEDDLGGVKVARINTAMMGKVFGGTIAEVMGGKVAREEAAMLKGIIAH